MLITINTSQKCIFVVGEKDLKLLSGILQGIAYLLPGYDLISELEVDFEDECMMATQGGRVEVTFGSSNTEQFKGD
jgi:hypothetical protein